jgi:hypothetical protein
MCCALLLQITAVKQQLPAVCLLLTAKLRTVQAAPRTHHQDPMPSFVNTHKQLIRYYLFLLLLLLLLLLLTENIIVALQEQL